MKHVSIIIKLHLYTFFISLLIGQSSPYRYSLFPGTPNLEDIYIVEEEEVFALMLEFSGANFDYVANEIFAPPSLNLTFKNVKWGKGNFSKKETTALSINILYRSQEMLTKKKLKKG